MTIHKDFNLPRYLTSLIFLSVAGINARILFGQAEVGAAILLAAVLQPLNEIRQVERNAAKCLLQYGFVIVSYCALCTLQLLSLQYWPVLILTIEFILVGVVAFCLKQYFETCSTSRLSRVRPN